MDAKTDTLKGADTSVSIKYLLPWLLALLASPAFATIQFTQNTLMGGKEYFAGEIWNFPPAIETAEIAAGVAISYPVVPSPAAIQDSTPAIEFNKSLVSPVIDNEVYVACGGVSDDVAAQAAATTGKNIHFANPCALTEPVNLGTDQCARGDSKDSTPVLIGPNFSSSATGVFVLTGNEENSPCVHDLGFIFTQPADVVLTATSGQSSGTTFTVASTTGFLNNNYCLDITTTGAIPAFTTFTASGNTLTASQTVTGLLNSDIIHCGPSRSNIAALGSTCGLAGEPICEYPPAIYSVASNRPRLYNINIQGGWDCLNTGAAAAVIDHFECGSLNIGWQFDGSLDTTSVHFWKNWGFGFTGANVQAGLQQLHGDGSAICVKAGRQDGLDIIGMQCEKSRFITTTNANNSQTDWSINDLFMDGTNANIEVNGCNSISFISGHKSGNLTTTANVSNPITIGPTASSCKVSFGRGFQFFTWGGSLGNDLIALSSGFLVIDGSGNSQPSGGTQHWISQTGGNLVVRSTYQILPSTMSVPLINATAGSQTDVQDNSCNNNSSGTFVNLGYDVKANILANNHCVGFTNTLPANAVAGVYGAPQTFSWSSPIVATNTTTYLGAGQYNATAANVATIIPYNALIRNFSVRVATAPGTGNTDTPTIYTGNVGGGGTASSLTCTISNSNNTASGTSSNAICDNTHSVTVSAGQTVMVQMVTSASATGTGFIQISFEADAI